MNLCNFFIQKVTLFFFALTLFFTTIFTSAIHGNNELAQHGDNDVEEQTTGPAFVSLGSFCGPATMIKSAGYRIASFPFDWMLTTDGEGIIRILEDNFEHFFDDRYLVTHKGGLLTHTYYHLLFSHEGNWQGENYYLKMPEFKERFHRRIRRFQELNNYPGKVVFIRSYWPPSDHHSVVFPDKGNSDITEEYTFRLNKTLSKLFPNLNFILVIMNPPQSGKPNFMQIDGSAYILREPLGIGEIIELAKSP